MLDLRIIAIAFGCLALVDSAQASDAFVAQVGSPVRATVSVPQVSVSAPEIALPLLRVPISINTDILAYLSGYSLPVAKVGTNVADIAQVGSGNTGGIAQSGLGNAGAVSQHGDSNTAWLTQLGAGNAGAIHQSGNSFSAAISQNGSLNRALIIQSF